MKTPKCNFSRHKWVRANEGCTKNPGVWDNGKGSMLFKDICSKCGLVRLDTRSYCGRGWENRVDFIRQ